MESAPDCLIAIDSSGSMINPRKSLSYAVLGAACVTNAYLRNDSKVAVYNFSDAPMGGKDILNYTDQREDIYRVLCKYFGGGTALDLEDLVPLIQGKKNLDFFIITDMKITNLEALIGFFGKIQNRVTAVHIGDNPYVARFEKAVEKKKNISIYTGRALSVLPARRRTASVGDLAGSFPCEACGLGTGNCGVLVLFGGQAIAEISGLASGEIAPAGWIWGLVIASLVVYVLAVILVGMTGILLLRDMFNSRLSTT